MTKLSIEPIDWHDVLEGNTITDNGSDASSDSSSDGGGSNSFSRTCPKIPLQPKGYLLLTLNYPRTATFNNAPSHIQKVMYVKLLDQLPTSMYGAKTNMLLQTVDCCFEYCKSGAVHYHSLIRIDCDNAFSIAGLVSDYSKAIHNKLPKKYSVYKENLYNVEFQRYRCPSHVIQYKTVDDPYVAEWKVYLHKEEYNK